MVPIAPVFLRSKEILTELVSLLDRERAALGELNSQEIIHIADKKKNLLDEMDQLNNRRINLLIKFDVLDRNTPSEEQFKAWIKDQDSSMDETRLLMSECESLLTICKTKNQTNARILHTLQKRNKQIFEMLQGHNSKNKVYTARGATQPVSSKHTLGRA